LYCHHYCMYPIYSQSSSSDHDIVLRYTQHWSRIIQLVSIRLIYFTEAASEDMLNCLESDYI
jgi:hypothetical protein